MKRVRLSRKRGWKMPPNTVKVDRTTPWGNPFVVGKFGTREQCVNYHARLLTAGHVVVGHDPSMKEQEDYRRFVVTHLDDLRGKDLACWCPLDEPCHADLLLKLANVDLSTTGKREIENGATNP